MPIRKREAAKTMLKGLDNIDWHALRHAYGPADDVPACIRDLASDDADLRQQAMDELFGNIYHQGTVYEATAHAVPFLIELAANQSIADRDGILALLADISDGGSYLAAHQFAERFADRREDPEFKGKLERELGWARDARRAVAAGVATFNACLSDPDRDVRLYAAYAIAMGTKPEGATCAALMAQLEREQETLTKAGLLLALGTIVAAMDQRDTALRALLDSLFERRDVPVLRLCAAIATLEMERDATPLAVIEFLLAALCRDDLDLDEVWNLLPWAHGQLSYDAGQYLVRSFENSETLLDHIDQAMAKRGLVPDCEIATTMLYAAFGFEYPLLPIERPAFGQLNPIQQRVLRAIADADRAWSWAGSISPTIHGWGFPHSHQDFCEYVNS